MFSHFYKKKQDLKLTKRMLVKDRIHQSLSLPFSPQYLKNINIPSTWQIFFSIALPNNDYLKNPLENQPFFPQHPQSESHKTCFVDNRKSSKTHTDFLFNDNQFHICRYKIHCRYQIQCVHDNILSELCKEILL